MKRFRTLLSVTLAVLMLTAVFSSFGVFASEATADSAGSGNVSIEDGEYLVENMKFDPISQDHQVLDVKDSSTEDKAVIIMNDKNGSDSEKFKVIKVSDNVYNIQCVESGKYWSVDDTVGEFPTLVQGEVKGEFSFETVKEDWVAIKDNASGLYLKVDDTMHKTVRPIYTSEMGDSLYLKWRFIDPASSSAGTGETKGDSITESKSTTSSSTGTSNATIWIIVGAGVLLLAVLIVVMILIIKSKKK